MLIDNFSENYNDFRTTSLIFHTIDTADIRPFRQPIRRQPYGERRAAFEQKFDKLNSAKIARQSISPWASPVDILRKTDGGLQMCVE